MSNQNHSSEELQNKQNKQHLLAPNKEPHSKGEVNPGTAPLIPTSPLHKTFLWHHGLESLSPAFL